jgi:hypothetical protein
MAGEDFFSTITTKINALHAAQRSKNKLDNKKDKFNKKNSNILKFIADILLLLGLLETFISQVNNFFAKGSKHEPFFKKTLTDCFHANIACNLDDKFKPSDVGPTNIFFQVKISKLDFFNLLKISPNSTAGKVFYKPIDRDINHAIKQALDSGTQVNWNNMLYFDTDPTDRNLLNVRVHQNYVNRPVSSLVNDIVNQIQMMPDFSLLLGVFDNSFGSFSSSIQPKIDPRSLFNKTMLNQYVDKVLDGGEDIVIDESFFSFSNEELVSMEKTMQNMSNNYLEIISCNNAESVVKPEELFPILNQLVSAGTYNEKIEIISAGMSSLQQFAGKNISNQDLGKFKIEFYFNILDQLTKVITSVVYEPQFLTLMFIYFRLANPGTGSPIDYTDFKDFLKKTKKILTCIVWSIFKAILLLIVIPLILKQLSKDNKKESIERSLEKYLLYKEQLLGLNSLLSTMKNLELISQISSSI